MPDPLKLYVKTWCPWCVQAKRVLDTRGYRYEEIDVEASRALGTALGVLLLENAALKPLIDAAKAELRAAHLTN